MPDPWALPADGTTKDVDLREDEMRHPETQERLEQCHAMGSGEARDLTKRCTCLRDMFTEPVAPGARILCTEMLQEQADAVPDCDLPVTCAVDPAKELRPILPVRKAARAAGRGAQGQGGSPCLDRRPCGAGRGAA
mmetsp:Transcript_41277/g.74060  ORF Transcript_41277/g.74060 Transcript_41277/m.74060 type:complete len:136 (+) Transcript_41277:164-571(+)